MIFDKIKDMFKENQDIWNSLNKNMDNIVNTLYKAPFSEDLEKYAENVKNEMNKNEAHMNELYNYRPSKNLSLDKLLETNLYLSFMNEHRKIVETYRSILSKYLLVYQQYMLSGEFEKARKVIASIKEEMKNAIKDDIEIMDDFRKSAYALYKTCLLYTSPSPRDS